MLLLPLWQAAATTTEQAAAWHTLCLYCNAEGSYQAHLQTHNAERLSPYISQYGQALTRVATTDAEVNEKMTAINTALSELIAVLTEQWCDLPYLDTTTDWILWPSGVLALLPWEAALYTQDADNTRDIYRINHLALQPADAPSAKYAIAYSGSENPKHDLYIDTAMIDIVSKNQSAATFIKAEQDLYHWLNNNPCAALVCHGRHDFSRPWNSSLGLVGLEPDELTIERLLLDDQLTTPPKELLLITCDGGICNPQDEELVGLHQAFPDIAQLVAALCPAPQVSSMLLMNKVMALRQQGLSLPMSLPKALRQAQQWITTLTAAQVEEMTGEDYSAFSESAPFADPVFWAIWVLYRS